MANGYGGLGGILATSSGLDSWRWTGECRIVFCSPEEAETLLHKSEEGSALFRVDPASFISRVAQLNVAYKFQTVILHHKFDIPSLSVVPGGLGKFLFKTNNASYDYIQGIHEDFFPRLKEFVGDLILFGNLQDSLPTPRTIDELLDQLKMLHMTTNKHLVTINEEDEVVDLSVAYGEPPTLRQVSIAIDWMSGSLVARIVAPRDSVRAPFTVEHFRQVLRENLPKQEAQHPHIFNVQIDNICQDLQSKDSSMRERGMTDLQDLVKIMETQHFYSLVQRGVINQVLENMCRNPATAYFTILKRVVPSSRLISEHYIEFFLNHKHAKRKDRHMYCLSLYQSLLTLCESAEFRQLFVQTCGVGKMLRHFRSLSVALWGQQARRYLRVNVAEDWTAVSSMNTPDSPHHEPLTPHSLYGSEQIPGTPTAVSVPNLQDRRPSRVNTVPQRIHTPIRLIVGEDGMATDEVGSPVATPAPQSQRSVEEGKRQAVVIPPLRLENSDHGNEYTARRSYRRTTSRMGLAMGAVGSEPSSSDRSEKEAPGEKKFTHSMQLQSLAHRVGESYMMADLSALTAFKRKTELETGSVRRMRRNVETVTPPVVDKFRAKEFSSGVLHRIKCYILCILDRLLDTQALKVGRVPLVNILVGELMNSYREPILRHDTSFKELVLKVLAHYADHVEYVHRRMWSQISGGMSLDKKDNLRRKLDIMVWRIHGRISVALEVSLTMDEVLIQLELLLDYMRQCHTRIMASQVVDVCMEVLLLLKHILVKKGKLSTRKLDMVPVLSAVLEVFDEIAVQNRHIPLSNLLIDMFIARQDNWEWLKSYAGILLQDTKVAREIIASAGHGRDRQGRDLLVKYRCRVVRHLRIFLELICKRYELEGVPMTEGSASTLKKSPSVVDSNTHMASKFEFLVLPTNGLFMQYFKQSSKNTSANAPLLMEMLRFFKGFFLVPGNPFLQRKVYIDAYISMHYLNFIKHYHSPSLDNATLELCRLHIDALSALATCSTTEIHMKFYQLRAVPFLVNEFDIEARLVNYERRLPQKTQAVSSTGSMAPSENKGVHNPSFRVNALRPMTSNTGTASMHHSGAVPGSPYGVDGYAASPRTEFSSQLSDTTPTPSATPDPTRARGFDVLTPVMGSEYSSHSSDDDWRPPPPKCRVPIKGLVLNPSMTHDNIMRGPPELPPMEAPPAGSVVQSLETSGLHEDRLPLMPIERDMQLDRSDLEKRVDDLNIDKESRKVYRDVDLHIAVLKLVLSLLVTPSGNLDSRYLDYASSRTHMSHILRTHLNHKSNNHVVPELFAALAVQPATPSFKLLKLLSYKMFQAHHYADRERIGSGAFGAVYKCLHTPSSTVVAAKLVSLPKHAHEDCSLREIFSEIAIMERLRGHDAPVAYMYDFGVEQENFWIVMKYYAASLRQWREKQTHPMAINLPTYMEIYCQALEAVQYLHAHNVNHFDIKADNFLLEPVQAGATLHDLLSAPPGMMLFRIRLADFGVSKLYKTAMDGYTRRAVGTECIQSPEMLVSEMNKAGERSLGANQASDVWSLGCLVFEIVTGRYLFLEHDHANFLQKISMEHVELLSQERIALLGDNTEIVDFLKYVLVRSPSKRPTVSAAIIRFKDVQRTVLARLRPLSGASLPTVNNPLSAVDRVGVVRGKLRKVRYSQEDLTFFKKTASHVTPRLLLAGQYVAQRRTVLKQLGVTHLVNCTPETDFPSHYEYLNLGTIEDSVDLLALLPEVFAFVKAALIDRGKILFFCSGGQVAPALITAFLMDGYGMSLLEALVMLSQARYVADPRPALLRQLIHYDETLITRRKLIQHKPRYRCICGANVTVLNDPVDDRFGGVNPLNCSCNVDHNSAHSDCPNIGCAAFLTKMQIWHNYEGGSSMSWAFTFKANVLETGGKTVEFDPMEAVPELLRHVVVSKNWSLYRCSVCHYITHAVHKRPSDRWAVVQNIPVPMDVRGSQLPDMRTADYFLEGVAGEKIERQHFV